jgi:hypothetical protein
MSRRIRRQRGAQPGNQNARKHGYYSKAIPPEMEMDILAAGAIRDIDGEIALTRAKIKSIIKHDPDNIDILLRAISTLERLVRTRSQIPRTFSDLPPCPTGTTDRFLDHLTGGGYERI